MVPDLVATLSRALATPKADDDPLVRGAMAHLNLVMIHPFRDGNGRMARALQTMVPAQDHLVELTFSSIEEWLGSNTQEYYDVLAPVGQGRWHPSNDASLWLKFSLRAHHMQAQTLRRRFSDAERQWEHIDTIVGENGLPERLGVALFNALLGLRVTRPSYLKHTALDERTATRDLVRASDLGLLAAKGERRGRHYLAGEHLTTIRAELAAVARRWRTHTRRWPRRFDAFAERDRELSIGALVASLSCVPLQTGPVDQVRTSKLLSLVLRDRQLGAVHGRHRGDEIDQRHHHHDGDEHELASLLRVTVMRGSGVGRIQARLR